MNTTPQIPFPIEELARAVAAQIAAHGGAKPTITVRRPGTIPVEVSGAPGVGADPPPIGAEVIIEIKYDTVTYALRFSTPTEKFNAWLFQLTVQAENEEPVDLALFEIVDPSNWLVSINTPYPIQIADKLTIEKVVFMAREGIVPDIPPETPRGT